MDRLNEKNEKGYDRILKFPFFSLFISGFLGLGILDYGLPLRRFWSDGKIVTDNISFFTFFFFLVEG